MGSGCISPCRRLQALIFGLLSSSATCAIPLSMTGLLWPVVLLLARTIYEYAIDQAVLPHCPLWPVTKAPVVRCATAEMERTPLRPQPAA